MGYDTKNWKTFKISQVFQVEKGKDNGEQFKYNPGAIPIISVQKGNNGVSFYVDKPKKNFKNGITVVGLGNGNMAGSFYHEYNFGAQTGNSVLLNKNMNRYSGVFIVSILKKIQDSGNYEFGYSLNTKRLKEITIKLPAKPDGSVDWDFMEQQGRLAEMEVLKESPLYDKIKKIIEEDENQEKNNY